MRPGSGAGGDGGRGGRPAGRDGDAGEPIRGAGGKGPRPGAAALFEAYADGLYGLCRTLVPAPVAARVVTGSVAELVGRAGRLRNPRRMRALAYAVAFRRCLAAGAGEGARALEPVCRSGPDGVRDRLAGYALACLEPRERAAFDLSSRHGLAMTEVADVLGVRPRRARRLAARGRLEFARALAVHAVAGHPACACPELALLLSEDGTPYGPALREPLFLHVDSCPDCRVLRPPGEGEPEAALRACAVPPVPAGLRASAERGPSPAGGRGAFPAGAGRPRAAGPVAAAVGVLVAGGLVGGLLMGGDTSETAAEGPVAGTVAAPVVAPPTPATSVAGSPTRAPRSTVAPTVVPTGTGTPRAAATPAKATPSSGDERPRRTPGAAKPSPAAVAPRGHAATTAPAPVTRAPTGPTRAQGTVSWSATRIAIGATGSASVRLRAAGGQVSWSLDVDGGVWLQVDRRSGRLASGESVTVSFSVDPARVPAEDWSLPVVVVPGGATLTVEGVGRRA